MLKLLSVLMLMASLYASNSGLTIVNKLKFDVVIDSSYGGVNYIKWDRGNEQIHLFPGEEVNLNIQCKNKVQYTAVSENSGSPSPRFFETKFVPKCGEWYTWNIVYQDEVK